jgi:hypothetical protein
MAHIKQRGAAGPSHSNDKAGEFARMRSGSAATMDELREFMGQMRGKSAQQIMGLVAESGLAQGILISTLGTVVLLVVFTVLPYAIYGPPEDKAAARQQAAAAAQKEAAKAAEKEPDKGEQPAAKEGASKEEAVKSMTKDLEEVKGKTSEDIPSNVDNLLDKKLLD